MPVFPEVGSISTVSELISPAFSIATIIAAPMRSFTLAAGLKYSSLARMVACTPCAAGKLRKRTIGVSPNASTMLSKIRPRPGRCIALASDEVSIQNSLWRQCVLELLLPLAAACVLHASQNPAIRQFAALQNSNASNNVNSTHLCCDIFKQVGVWLPQGSGWQGGRDGSSCRSHVDGRVPSRSARIRSADLRGLC